MVLVVPIIAAVGFGLFGAIFKVVQDHRHKRGLVGKSLAVEVHSSENFVPIYVHGNASAIIEQNISLAINGVNYLFGMPPTTTDTEVSSILTELAIEFCEQRGSDLGFNMKTFSLCVSPIVNELEEYLTNSTPMEEVEDSGEERNNTKPIQFALEVNGVSYVFEYITGVDQKYAAATLSDHFCHNKGHELLAPYFESHSIVDEEQKKVFIREGCNTPISEALYEKIIALD